MQTPEVSVVVREGFREEGTAGLIREESPGDHWVCEESARLVRTPELGSEKIYRLSKAGKELLHPQGRHGEKRVKQAQACISSWTCPHNYCWEGALFRSLKGQKTGSEPKTGSGPVVRSHRKGPKGAKPQALCVPTC